MFSHLTPLSSEVVVVTDKGRAKCNNVNLSESDGSDAELSECSSDRKTFMSETDQRRDSESSGGQVQTPLQSSITSPTQTSFHMESPSSVASEKSSSGFNPGLEEEVMDHSRPLLMKAK
ncbi:hypothetical protein cypCar_00041276 [Cyprinus carpio]|nr:hypothetical protein cypCar_00041276 [Cyprinus carpio]